MIQLKDKLKVNGGTRRYMEMIGLSLAFSLFAVSCTQDSDVLSIVSGGGTSFRG